MYLASSETLGKIAAKIAKTVPTRRSFPYLIKHFRTLRLQKGKSKQLVLLFKWNRSKVKSTRDFTRTLMMLWII
jgi:hypothetical protein